MGVPLVILTYLGAQLPRALHHPSTQAAAAVTLILPPDQIKHTQGLEKPAPPKVDGFTEIQFAILKQKLSKKMVWK